MGNNHSVFIAGAGGIGSAVGLILREWGEQATDIYLGDVNVAAAQRMAGWIIDNAEVGSGLVQAVAMPPEDTSAELDAALRHCSVLLDCLPGSQAPRLAKLARLHGLHYANLTEYVAETEQIKEIAQGASEGFVLQTGLAPGFIGVLAHSLFKNFCQQHGVERVDHVAMKVGALTHNAMPPHYYGFTWSPIGVATEYVKPAVVVRDYVKQVVDALSARQTIMIQGQTYEEDLTSGGAADLPDFLAGRTKTLEYKTLRHPGHYGWVASLLNSPVATEPKAAFLQASMLESVPLVEDDFVVVYAGVQGKNSAGVLHLLEKTYHIGACQVGGAKLKAIQAATAAPLAECARMLMEGQYQGVTLQSQIDPKDFLGGKFVQRVYGA